MRLIVFSSRSYDRASFTEVMGKEHEMVFQEAKLDASTARLAEGFAAVCAFVNDDLDDSDVWEQLSRVGVRCVVLRCAGFNGVDLEMAKKHNIAVYRVPAYSPTSVAEHTLALMLALNRHLPRAHNRVRDGNFSLEGLEGFTISNRTVGIVGTGAIGRCVAKLLRGFGCRLLAFDLYPSEETAKDLGITYVELDTLLAESDIITLHIPMTKDTHHLISKKSLAQMKRAAMLVNTSRGGLVDTRAAIEALKTGQLGSLAIDVYEEEEELFFADRSTAIIQDDVFSRLLTFPNVLVTAHQAFFTREALRTIAETTAENLRCFAEGKQTDNELTRPAN
eukprot:m.75919 g.75919  ORF g.75919 m.75919 type:complete len:335 (-) comp8098_c0_seq6:178-1182(-)